MDRTLRAKSAISASNTEDNSRIISFDSPASFNKLSLQSINISKLAALLSPFDKLLLSLANFPNGIYFDTLIKSLTNDTYFSLMNSLYSLRYNETDTTDEYKSIVDVSIHSLQTLRRFINIYDETKITELRILIENSQLANYNGILQGVVTMDGLVDNSFNIIPIVYTPAYIAYTDKFGRSGDDATLPYLSGLGTYK
jgi:hypothetical protein